MCKECGCGLPDQNPAQVGVTHQHGPERIQAHPHNHDHDHAHPHSHEHTHEVAPGHDPPHSHNEPSAPQRRTVELRQAILARNDLQAERNRGFFRGQGTLALNVTSSPGSGKTTFLKETLKALSGELTAGVIVGDLATDNDAQHLRETGVPVVQVTTGTMCHLEAEMIGRAVTELPSRNLDLLIIENVGNLVCPAAYDLGEDLRVVLLSVTEGEDKPLKYPPIFQSADVVVVSKADLLVACGCDREQLLVNIARAAPRAVIFETSARTGAGMAAWCNYLREKQRARKALGLLA